ncbi:MAG: antibiotic biosynthesis monooxygenase family protein [Candidatus Aenigmatarchaeota archaeon]
MPTNVWKFYVKEGHEDEFVRMNTPGGDWAELFKRSPDYLGTQVGREIDDRRVYLVLDKWATKAAFDDFIEEHAADYAALDARHKKHYDRDENIGFFEWGL